jgi:hypothetical protein
MPLAYINPSAPCVDPPTYPGQTYDALVPATLNLAERGHYRQGESHWKPVRRFVPDAEIEWC